VLAIRARGEGHLWIRGQQDFPNILPRMVVEDVPFESWPWRRHGRPAARGPEALFVVQFPDKKSRREEIVASRKGAPLRRFVIPAVLTVLTITVWTQSGFAQPTDEIKALRKDVDTLKEGQTAIQKDLQDIKKLLQARPTVAARPAQEAVVSVEGASFKGQKTAKVTMVDFTDYQ
jgi:hypothetical protein